MNQEKHNPLKAGDRLPDIELTDGSGEGVRLRDLAKDNYLVLFFYPKDESPFCTAEACAFRDAHNELESLGVVLAGISSDAPEQHEKFAANHDLNFILLSDTEGEAARAFGLGKTLGMLSERVTFVADKKGVLRHRYSSQFRPLNHVREALRAVRELRGAQ